MNDLIATKLKSLKLSGISKTFDIRNDEAIKEGLSYVEFFELLLNDETANRVTNARAKKMWIVNTFLYSYYSVILEILYSTGVI